MPVTSRPSSVDELGSNYFSWKIYVKIQSWYSPTTRGLLINCVNYLSFQGTNIFHLGKRKIINSKVPAGRGYVSSQEGISKHFRNHLMIFAPCKIMSWNPIIKSCTVLETHGVPSHDRKKDSPNGPCGTCPTRSVQLPLIHISNKKQQVEVP